MAALQNLERIFHLGLEAASEGERRLVLERECVGDLSLVAEVQQLLDAAGEKGDFFDLTRLQPEVFVKAGQRAWHLSSRKDVLPDETPISVHEHCPQKFPATGTIGPYRVLKFLGGGGMGVVWLARLEKPFAPLVAVKLLHVAGCSPQNINRFHMERLNLARLDHPSIA